jgi:hypothetical protein
MISKDLDKDVEIITKSNHTQNLKKRSAKQKEREKKKLQKLLDKKDKQNKMRDILSSLASHKNDIKEADYARLQSAKTLGKAEVLPKPKLELTVEESEPESDLSVEIISSRTEKPKISDDIRMRVEDDFVSMDQALSILKKNIEEDLK